jgi:hypothetical protein
VIIGRVLRASTRGFDCGTHSKNIGEYHNFGGFVKAPIASNSSIYAIGLIYKIEIKDDQLIGELVLGSGISEQLLRDQRENRLIPVETKIINVGYVDTSTDRPVYSLPPRPPMSLSDVEPCTPDEIKFFVQQREASNGQPVFFQPQQDFFRLILGASEVPTDDLLCASVHIASETMPETTRYAFHVECGRRIGRLLGNDLKRLSHILNLIRPV